jgi:hypothetical protein
MTLSSYSVQGRRRHLPSAARRRPRRRERLLFGPTRSGALSDTVAEEREKRIGMSPQGEAFRIRVKSGAERKGMERWKEGEE